MASSAAPDARSARNNNLPKYDFRKLKFAIVCLHCNYKVDNIKAMTIHLQKNCPGGKPYKIVCGHCELRTSCWPRVVKHLHKPGMFEKLPIKEQYKV